MGYQALRAIIEQRFQTLVATPRSLTTYYDNQRAVVVTTLHCRLMVIWNKKVQQTISGRRFRLLGAMVVFIHIPTEAGTAAGESLADAIEPHFRSVTADGVRWYTPSFTSEGVGEGSFWTFQLFCPFSVDEFTS